MRQANIKITFIFCSTVCRTVSNSLLNNRKETIFLFNILCNKTVVCYTNVANIFEGFVIYISGKYSRGGSSASQPSDFSPAMDKQKTILRNGVLFFHLPIPCEKSQNHYHPPWRFLKIFSGVDEGKATLFQRLLSPHPHPSKIVVIVAGMIGKFRKMACHFAPDAPCPGTS